MGDESTCLSVGELVRGNPCEVFSGVLSYAGFATPRTNPPKAISSDWCTQSADTSKNKWNIMGTALETWGAKSLVSPNNLRYELECLHRILAWVGTPMKHSRIQLL